MERAIFDYGRLYGDFYLSEVCTASRSSTSCPKRVHSPSRTGSERYLHRKELQLTQQVELDPEKRIHQSSDLYVIWNQKSFWLAQVARNPFHSQFFLWTDIGQFNRLSWPEKSDTSPELSAEKIVLLSIHPFSEEEQELSDAGFAQFFSSLSANRWWALEVIDLPSCCETWVSFDSRTLHQHGAIRRQGPVFDGIDVYSKPHFVFYHWCQRLPWGPMVRTTSCFP